MGEVFSFRNKPWLEFRRQPVEPLETQFAAVFSDPPKGPGPIIKRHLLPSDLIGDAA